jgi:hypothetical protein
MTIYIGIEEVKSLIFKQTSTSSSRTCTLLYFAFTVTDACLLPCHSLEAIYSQRRTYCDSYWRFGEACFLHVQGRPRLPWTRKLQVPPKRR